MIHVFAKSLGKNAFHQQKGNSCRSAQCHNPRERHTQSAHNTEGTSFREMSFHAFIS